jgi:hypothetical protein
VSEFSLIFAFRENEKRGFCFNPNSYHWCCCWFCGWRGGYMLPHPANTTAVFYRRHPTRQAWLRAFRPRAILQKIKIFIKARTDFLNPWERFFETRACDRITPVPLPRYPIFDFFPFVI